VDLARQKQTLAGSKNSSILCEEIDIYLSNMKLGDRITSSLLGCIDASQDASQGASNIAADAALASGNLEQRQPSVLLGLDTSSIHLYNCIQIVKKMHPWFTRYSNFT
jgi:hypothetical protein